MQAFTLPPDLPFQHSYLLATRWSDEDNQAVLNNAVYATLFEEARLRYFSSLGQIKDGRFPFLLAQCTLRYLRPGRAGSEVRVELATLRLGRSSFEQVYRVSTQGGEVLCEGEALLVCYDPATKKSAPMSSAFRAALLGAEGTELGS